MLFSEAINHLRASIDNVIWYLVGQEDGNLPGPVAGIVEGMLGNEEIIVDVRLLAPVTPRSTIIGVARNFVAQASELAQVERSGHPLLFMKPHTAVLGPDEAVILPKFSTEVTFEAELCAVIGHRCKEVAADDVQDFIFGYTCGNDLTAKDVQATD